MPVPAKEGPPIRLGSLVPVRILPPAIDAGRRTRRESRRPDRGFTLVEATIVFSLMSLALLTGLALLGHSTGQAEAATSIFLNEDRARGALSGMFDILTETSIEHVDTTMRIHGPFTANDVSSDRFTIPGTALKQCTSPTCSYHTRDDLTVFANRFHCGFEFCSGLLGIPVTRGKTWHSMMTSCPLDGSPLSSTARLDGVKFFVARDATGAFTKMPDGSPYWGGLVFLFPCVSQSGLCELRRYDVYVSDLLANPPSYTTGWNRFPPLKPSMIDLFDFGTDGTTNGIVDGKVPLTNLQSDARNETFTAGTYQGSPAILVVKSLPNPSGPLSYPQRQLSLRIDLQTGDTDFMVEHRDSSTSLWTATCEFTRAPRTVIQGMTEFAISTAVSHPFDAITNPSGVSEPNVVRVTVGTSDAPRDEGTQWLNHVESFQIKTRN